MEDNTIIGIIQQALTILEKEVGLAKSTLDVVASRSFKPISEFFKEKQEVWGINMLFHLGCGGEKTTEF